MACVRPRVTSTATPSATAGSAELARVGGVALGAANALPSGLGAAVAPPIGSPSEFATSEYEPSLPNRDQP